MPPDPPFTAPSKSAAISDAVSRVVAEYVGRGLTSVRTTIHPGLVVCVMRDTFIKAERKLVETGQEAFVKDLRLRFQQTMREDLIRVVEQVTGRRVEAFLSDHHIDPDIAVETFILAEDDGEGDSDHPESSSDNGAASDGDGAR